MEYLQGGSQLGGEAQGVPEEGWSEERHVEGIAKPTKQLSEALEKVALPPVFWATADQKTVRRECYYRTGRNKG